MNWLSAKSWLVTEMLERGSAGIYEKETIWVDFMIDDCWLTEWAGDHAAKQR